MREINSLCCPLIASISNKPWTLSHTVPTVAEIALALIDTIYPDGANVRAEACCQADEKGRAQPAKPVEGW